MFIRLKLNQLLKISTTHVNVKIRKIFSPESKVSHCNKMRNAFHISKGLNIGSREVYLSQVAWVLQVMQPVWASISSSANREWRMHGGLNEVMEVKLLWQRLTCRKCCTTCFQHTRHLLPQEVSVSTAPSASYSFSMIQELTPSLPPRESLYSHTKPLLSHHFLSMAFPYNMCN